MPVTSNQILQSILLSINNALEDSQLTEDNRGALIDQYERTAQMIRNGYQYSEIDLENLPQTIRNETITLLNDVTSTFSNTSQTLIDNFNTQLNLLVSHNQTVQESNTILNTVVSGSQQIQDNLTTFQAYLNTLEQDKQTIQTFQNDINSYVIPIEATYKIDSINQSFANIGNHILLIQQDQLGLKLNIKVV